MANIADAGLNDSYKNQANFTLHVKAPANTAPTVSVTGVANGATYQVGTGPAAGCAVSDVEDGSPVVNPVITGSLDANGLGTQTATCSYTDQGGLSASASATYTIVDQTPPAVSYVLNPAAPDGLDGWYKSNVSLTWTVTESDTPGSLVKDGCVDQNITTDLPETTFTCKATSAGGTTGPVSVTLKRDATAPVVTVRPERAADSNGWYNHPVAFTFSSNDGSACEAPKTYAGPDGGSVTVSGTCTDQAGNVGTGTYTFQYDATAPVISAAVAPGKDPTTGWWNLITQAPTVTYNCADDTSQVASCTAPFTFGEGANQTHTGTAVDNAGNTATATVENINVDLSAPSITAAVAPAKAPSGWWNSSTGAPTITYTCADAGPSGLAGICPAAFTFAEGENQSHAETISDIAGNPATATVSDVDVDTTVPTITFTGRTPANEYGWNNTDVTVTWSCADGLSGAVQPGDSKTVKSEGANQTATGACADNAGNSASHTVEGINIDKTAPQISGSADRAPNAFGWYKEDVTVSFTCADNLSGLLSCASPSTLGEGASQSVTGTATDKAGNTASATVQNINIDKTAPVITDAGPTAAPNGQNGWYTSLVINKFMASDSLSGLAGPATILKSTEGQEGSAVKVSSGPVTDLAGNVAPAIDSAAFMIDLSNPTNIAFIDGPAAGGSYYFGFVPAAPTCTAEDAISGLASCVVTGYNTAVGTHTLTATAKDNAGRMASITREYTVQAWTLKGFYQPVDMNNVYNTVKNGSTVPLKFEIFAGPTELTDTAYVKSLVYGQTTCSLVAPTDEIETVATGSTVLRYDTLGSQFIYNWKTPTAPGKCYRVTMTTLDGSTLMAYFKLK